MGTAWDQENLQINLSFLLKGSSPICKASEDLGTLGDRLRPSVELLLISKQKLLFPRTMITFHSCPLEPVRKPH